MILDTSNFLLIPENTLLRFTDGSTFLVEVRAPVALFLNCDLARFDEWCKRRGKPANIIKLRHWLPTITYLLVTDDWTCYS